MRFCFAYRLNAHDLEEINDDRWTCFTIITCLRFKKGIWAPRMIPTGVTVMTVSTAITQGGVFCILFRSDGSG